MLYVGANRYKPMVNGNRHHFAFALLPVAYQEVEYIQSSGKQYLNLGIKPNNNTRMEMLLYTTCTSSFYAAGSRTHGGGKIWFAQSGTLTRARVSATVNGSSTTASTNGTLWSRTSSGQLYDIVLQTNGDGTYDYSIDDLTNNRSYSTTKAYDAFEDGEVPANIMVFALASGYIISGTNRLYRFNLYQDRELVRHLVPCYRVADNVVGMYDTVNGVFYGNAGSGSFTKGADVE